MSKEATLRPSAQPSGDHRAMTAASKTTQARTRTAALIVLSIAIVTTPPILWGIEMTREHAAAQHERGGRRLAER